MPFRFRLEKVLRHRRREVDRRGRAVAEAAGEVARLGRRVDELAVARARAAGRGDDPADVDGLRRRAAWIVRLEAEADRVRARRAEAEAALAARREELREAWRAQEVLERLRARQRAAWLAEEARRERRDLDEIGQQRAWAGRRSEAAADPAELADPVGTAGAGRT